MDLRFKIIGEHVQGGWDKTQGALASLRSKFADFFGGAKAGMLGVVGGITAGISAIVGVFRSMREQAIAEFNEMEERGVRYAQTLETAIRKIKMASSEQMKLRVVEDVRQEIQSLKSELAKAKFDDATKDIFAETGENARAIVSGLFGMGFKTQDERVQDRIASQIKQLEKLLATAEKKDVSKFGEAEIAAAQFERMSAKELQAATTPQAREDVMRKRAEMARFSEEDARAALAAKPGDEDLTKRLIESIGALAKAEADLFQASQESVAAVQAAELKAFQDMEAEAERIADQKKKDAAAVESVREAARRQKMEGLSPAEQIAMNEARLSELRKKFSERDAFGNFTATTEERAGMAKEALSLRGQNAGIKAEEESRIAEQERARLEKLKAAVGQPLGLDQLFDRRYGQGVKEDPMLKEAKEQTKTLHQIERKLGMTA